MVGLQRFDLEPVFRAPLLVFAFPMLCNDAFEAMLFNRFEECAALGFHVIRKPDPAAVVRNQFPKHSLSLF